MSVREYIGARYVPIFADPLEWDATRTYEPLTVVLYQGNSYTSRQAVPANIPITNTTYWAQTGNYNAQVEQYRAEVETFNNRITQNTNNIAAIDGIIPSADFDSTNTVKKYVDDSVSEIEDIIPSADFDSTNTVKKYVDDSVSEIEDIIPSADFDSTNTVKKYVDDSISEIGNIIPSADFDSTNTVKKTIDDNYGEMLSLHKQAIANRNHQGGFNIIGEFDLGDYGSVQGCTWIEGDNYVIGCSVTGTDNVNLFKWNRASNTITGPTLVQGYHDNSMTYMPETDELYICEAFLDSNWDVLIPTITVVKYSTMAFVRRIQVPMQEGAEGIYGLAYDRAKEIFYATCWRGNVEGKSNRIYKYDKTLTQYLGSFDLDDFTSRYTKTSSNQGVQYVYDGTLWEIYYDFGLIAGFDVNTGERKVLFNVPYFANGYRFVGELEAFTINEDNLSAICFTVSGAYECGIYKDVYEDKIIPATNTRNAKFTLYCNKISQMDTTTIFNRQNGAVRNIQDAINFGAINNVYVRASFADAAAATTVNNTIYCYNFKGELQLGAVSNPNTFNNGIKIVGSDISIWGGVINGDTNLPEDLQAYYACITIYNSRVRIFACSFNPQRVNAYAIAAAFNSIVTTNLTSAQTANKSIWLNSQTMIWEAAGQMTKVAATASDYKEL